MQAPVVLRERRHFLPEARREFFDDSLPFFVVWVIQCKGFFVGDVKRRLILLSWSRLLLKKGRKIIFGRQRLLCNNTRGIWRRRRRVSTRTNEEYGNVNIFTNLQILYFKKSWYKQQKGVVLTFFQLSLSLSLSLCLCLSLSLSLFCVCVSVSNTERQFRVIKPVRL